MTEKTHLFISYSRKDAEFAERLKDALSTLGVPVWVDVHDLQPGTPNWQIAIRAAVKVAYVVIVIGSPDCALSPAVQAEIELALAYKNPIFPVWARGDVWVDCVPLQLVSHQYFDLRSDSYSAGLEKLTHQVRLQIHGRASQSEPTPRPSIPIQLTNGQEISVDPQRFETLQQVLNHVYLRYLVDVYDAYRYGADWVLVTQWEPIQRILVPWNWIQKENIYQPLGEVTPKGSDQAPTRHGFTLGSRWRLVRPRLLNPWVIETDLPYVSELAFGLSERPQNAEALTKLVEHICNPSSPVQHQQLASVLRSASVETLSIDEARSPKPDNVRYLMNDGYSSRRVTNMVVRITARK